MTTPQRLSPVDGLAQLSFVIQEILERLAAEHDISIIQARLLGVLRDREPTMNELARLLGLEKSSVTGLVDRAERRGLVARVPSSTDGRAVLVTLTAEGRSLVSSVAGDFADEVSTMLCHLPARDREALSRLVSRLLVAHAADHDVDLFANLIALRVRSQQPDHPLDDEQHPDRGEAANRDDSGMPGDPGLGALDRPGRLLRGDQEGDERHLEQPQHH